MKIVSFRNILYFSFLSLLISQSWSNGNIDVLPQGFMADVNSPYAIHFTVTSSFFSGVSLVTAKVRVLPVLSAGSANNYTWAVTGLAGWRNDIASLATLPILSVSNTTVSGYFFAKSLSNSYFGTCTCTIRFYKSTLSYVDVTAVTPFTAWNPATNAGWLTGTYNPGANYIALAEDSANNVLGSYITESTGLAYNYTGKAGYFKIAVPIGTVSKVEFRDTNNQFVGSITGPWTILSNSTTTIPRVAGIPSNYWINNP